MNERRSTHTSLHLDRFHFQVTTLFTNVFTNVFTIVFTIVGPHAPAKADPRSGCTR
jgi:hypothetical protein